MRTLGGIIVAAVVGLAALEFLDGSGIHIKDYAHHAGERFLDTVRDINGAKATQAQADYAKCQEASRAAVASAKADYRKVKQAFDDCHDQYYLTDNVDLYCGDKWKAGMAVKARIDALKVDTCKAPT